jgi:hypothetical protein
MARVRLSQNQTHSIHNEAEADTPAEYTAIGNIPCGAKTGREQDLGRSEHPISPSMWCSGVTVGCMKRTYKDLQLGSDPVLEGERNSYFGSGIGKLMETTSHTTYNNKGGYAVFLQNAHIAEKSTVQPSTTLPTTETELSSATDYANDMLFAIRIN